MTTRTIYRAAAIAVVLLSALIVGCGGRISLSGLTAQELYTQGRQKYDGHKYRQSLEYFQKIVFDYPGESIVDTAQYYVALSYFGNEEYALAEVEFNRLVSYYPASIFVPSAQFMSAVSQFEAAPGNYALDQTAVKDAVQKFDDFLIDYPESEMAPDVKAYLLKARNRLARKDFEAGMTYYRMGAPESAKIYFKRVIDEYTGTDYAAQALFNTAEIDLKLRNFGDAQNEYENFVVVYPDHKLVDKAQARAAESVFRAGEWALDHADSVKAKVEFQRLVDKYPNDKRVDKAKAYLNQIGDIPVDTQPEATKEGS